MAIKGERDRLAGLVGRLVGGGFSWASRALGWQVLALDDDDDDDGDTTLA